MAGDRRRHALAHRHGHVEIAPVDPQVIAGFLQHGLVLRADPHHRQPGHLRTRPHDGLLGLVHDKLRRGVEVNRYFVLPVVDGADLPSQIRHRPGDQIQVVRQEGSGKGEPHCHARRLEVVDGAGGQDLQARLPHGRQLARLGPHEAIRPAVDPHHAAQGVGRAGPMLRPTLRQPVAGRPDAEIRIVDHQRHGRRPPRGRVFRRDSRNGQRTQKSTRDRCPSRRIHDRSFGHDADSSAVDSPQQLRCLTRRTCPPAKRTAVQPPQKLSTAYRPRERPWGSCRPCRASRADRRRRRTSSASHPVPWPRRRPS